MAYRINLANEFEIELKKDVNTIIEILKRNNIEFDIDEFKIESKPVKTIIKSVLGKDFK